MDRKHKSTLFNKKRILFAAGILLVLILAGLYFIRLTPRRPTSWNAEDAFPEYVDLGTQSCTVYAGDGAHALKLEGVCGNNGMILWDGALMWQSVEEHVSEQEYPTYRLCEGFRVEVRVEPRSLSQDYRRKIYLKTDSGLEELDGFGREADFAELAPGTYLIQYDCSVHKGDYYSCEAAFFWLTV